MSEQRPDDSAAWDFELHAQFEYEASLEAERESRGQAKGDIPYPDPATEHGPRCQCETCIIPF